MKKTEICYNRAREEIIPAKYLIDKIKNPAIWKDEYFKGRTAHRRPRMTAKSMEFKTHKEKSMWKHAFKKEKEFIIAIACFEN